MNEKLLAIQSALKVSKNQTNTFGGYKYRSCEDILEAVKPLLEKQGLTLIIGDTIELVGERYYVKATAILSEGEKQIAQVVSYAREEETKKGMDGSQITGAASSYARKYALNGLFLIDDTKDSDSTNTHEEKVPEKKQKYEKIADGIYTITVIDQKKGETNGMSWIAINTEQGRMFNNSGEELENGMEYQVKVAKGGILEVLYE